MNNNRDHEINYRSSSSFKKMQSSKITVCGAGALGSNLINILCRQGYENISVIDMDRVEKHNIATQLYTLRDVGQKKANALKGLMLQSLKSKINSIDKELVSGNSNKLLSGSDLVVDVFDNWKSRKLIFNYCFENNIPCVHAGMSDDGFSEIKWSEQYKIPNKEVEQEDVCDYPLAANLVHFTTAVLAEVITQFVTSGIKLNRDFTLKDIMLHKM